ncbi:hypothetical protein [Ulvibacter litoralis]|uniref:DoxX-like family protein n=1 Tax=Ulvibacter litoralis TaxID=227084 RepID=A0A1G7H1U4_9FLAO|nr:hypothetical protein [Ulvibacter litoralis]GHC59169.1 hypothetical protein GCM10008083_24940 [Ulvibacter litoralis]SDE94406.1 hypothetical protein SAMN05421855_103478 [Ulvibacter litoralis]
MNLDIKPPNSFWIVAFSALFWSIIEIYFSSFEIEFLQQNLTTEEFEKMLSLPFWYIIVYMIALFSEIIGIFMLFIRQKIAIKFFGVSLITLLFIEFYWLFIIDIKKTSALFSIIIPIAVIAIATFLYFYSKNAVKKGWIK